MLAASSSYSSCLVGVVVGRGSRNVLELTIVVAQLFATHVKLEDHFGQLVELVPAVHRVLLHDRLRRFVRVQLVC